MFPPVGLASPAPASSRQCSVGVYTSRLLTSPVRTYPPEPEQPTVS